MAGIVNDVLYALNSDFTGGNSALASESNGLVTNGKLWVGSTALNAGGTHINVGSITSPDSSVTIGYTSPNITAQVSNPILNVSGILTSSQIKNLHGTPITIIPAPGVGKIIRIMSVVSKLNYGGSNAFVNGGARPIVLSYGTYSTDSTPNQTLTPTLVITATANTTTIPTIPTLDQIVVSSVYDNVAITAYNFQVTEISGNAANNNTIGYSVSYMIVTI